MGNLCSCFEKFSFELTKSENIQKSNKIEYPTHKKSIKDFEILKFLGSGGFGMVTLCLDKKTQELRAIKMLLKYKIKLLNISEENVINEKNILKRANHPNIIKMFDSFQDKHFFYLSMEYVEGGTLKDILKKYKRLDIQAVQFYSCKILEALKYLHQELNIIYRDLKLENILIDKDGNPKICDFGLSKFGKKANTICGTPDYMAPEILESIFK